MSILEEELEKFEAALAAIKTGPIITQLDREYQRIIDDELAWLFPQLNGLPEEDKDKIRHFAHRMKISCFIPPDRPTRPCEGRASYAARECPAFFGLTREEK